MTEPAEGFWVGVSLLAAVAVISMGMLLVNIGTTIARADEELQMQSDDVKAYRQIFQYDNKILKQLDAACLILTCRSMRMYTEICDASGNTVMIWDKDTAESNYSQKYVLDKLDKNKKYRCTVITDTMTPNYSSLLGFRLVMTD
jgi:hypothetical protein